MVRYGLIAALLALMLTACMSGGRPAAASLTTSADGTTITGGYSNPFAYCHAVVMVDHPGNRYTGPEPPPDVVAGLAKVFNAPPGTQRSQAFLNGTFWRCMNGRVYACNVGANLPCESPANTNRIPTESENRYCSENPGSSFIPMYVTGHNTIYDWRCQGTSALAGKALSEVDKRGYISDIWHHIAPPRSTRP